MKKHIISIVFVVFAAFSVVSAQNFMFNYDLSVGTTGQDVTNLQTWLINNGFNIPAVSSGQAQKGYFGSETKAAVAAYQQSVGLPAFGFFGPMTRARFNGGNGGHVSGNTPVINGVDAPTTLTVGQTGTWTIRATDPLNGTLSYSILWGDEPGYVATGGTMAVPAVMQTNTFTHSYSSAGNYMVTFTVRNTAGQQIQESSSVQVTGSNTAGPLKIISPNGGEVWQTGTTHNITWTSPSYLVATNADLQLMPSNACTAQYCTQIYRMPYTIATNIPINQNSYSWNVGYVSYINNAPNAGVGPNPVPDGQYTIQICQTGTSVCALSNSQFTITSGQTSNVPDINVVSPNGGEILPIGSQTSISWRLDGSITSQDRILLTLKSYNGTGGGIIGVYDPSVVGNSINWVVPSYLVTGDLVSDVKLGSMYKIRAELYDGQPNTGFSFTVPPSTAHMLAYDESDNYFTLTQ